MFRHTMQNSQAALVYVRVYYFFEEYMTIIIVMESSGMIAQK